MTSEPLLTVEDVAKWLAVSERRVMDLAREKVLPGYKVGKEWRFEREELVAHLKNQRETGSNALQ